MIKRKANPQILKVMMKIGKIMVVFALAKVTIRTISLRLIKNEKSSNSEKTICDFVNQKATPLVT